MSLENTFQKVEKPPEEKRIEVITSEDSIVDNLKAYFEQTKYKGLYNLDERRKYFSSCMDFFKSFELTPKIILRFNQKFKTESLQVLGLYLSAMIQTSYNQGFNNFTFEKVDANCFGALLKGQPKKPIKITTKTIKGDSSLWCAKNSKLTTKTLEGDRNLWYAKNCSLTAETLKGHQNLWWANNCLAEITNYQGRAFGYDMTKCIIKSGNEKTLETIKNQVDREWNNKFELTK